MGLGSEGGLAEARGLSPVEYEQLISAIREVVHRVVPPHAIVLVVSRGDDELLRLGPRQALHFPQDEDGRYAGYHPADSDAAIAMVEQMRGKGAEYLLFPATGFWWLDHYEALRTHLEQNCQVIESNDYCWIARLSEGTSLDADTTFMAEAPQVLEAVPPVREVLDALLPAQSRIAFLVTEPNGVSLEGHEIWRVPSESQTDDATPPMESLRALERSGIEFLVIPAPTFGWLAEHPEVTDRLRSHHRFVTRQEHLCEIYELHASAPEPSRQGREEGIPEGSDEKNGTGRSASGRRSLGEILRGILFPSRRNDRRP